MKIGTNIKKLRIAQGLTQDQLAEKLYVTRQTVSSWERSASNPNLEQLEAISAALEIDVMTLLYGTPKNYRPSRKRIGVAVGLTLLLLVLWAASWWLEPWAKATTGTQLTYHLYYYNCYYVSLVAAVGGLAGLSLAGLRWELTLGKRGRRLCLGIALVLLALLALGPVCWIWIGGQWEQIPQWISQLSGLLFLHTYRKGIVAALGILFGGFSFLAGNSKPKQQGTGRKENPL